MIVGRLDDALLETGAFLVIDVAGVFADRTGIVNLHRVRGESVAPEERLLAGGQVFIAGTQLGKRLRGVMSALQIALDRVQTKRTDLFVDCRDLRDLPVNLGDAQIALGLMLLSSGGVSGENFLHRGLCKCHRNTSESNRLM